MTNNRYIFAHMETKETKKRLIQDLNFFPGTWGEGEQTKRSNKLHDMPSSDTEKTLRLKTCRHRGCFSYRIGQSKAPCNGQYMCPLLWHIYIARRRLGSRSGYRYLSQQECFPVWCVPPACYRTGGGLCQTEPSHRQRPPTETPRQRAPWIETPPCEQNHRHV